MIAVLDKLAVKSAEGVEACKITVLLPYVFVSQNAAGVAATRFLRSSDSINSPLNVL